MLLNTIEDPHQLLAPKMLDKLYVLMINGDMAVVNEQELEQVDLDNPKLPYSSVFKDHALSILQKTPILKTFVPKKKPLNESVLRIRHVKDLSRRVDVDSNKLSKHALEKKISGLIQPGAYTIFLSKNDALVGQNLFTYDYEMKQRELNEQLFLRTGNETGGSFSQSLRISFDRQPHVAVEPLKKAMPNLYSLLAVYVTLTNQVPLK